MTDSIPDLAERKARNQRAKEAREAEAERLELIRLAAIERATKRAWKGIYPPLFRKAMSRVAEARQ